MNSETSNDGPGRDEERIAKEMVAQLLALPHSTLCRVCQLLMWRDRLLNRTRGDYGLFRYTDFFDYGLADLEVNQVSEMKHLPTRFRELVEAEAGSGMALLDEQIKHEVEMEERNRSRTEIRNEIFLRTYQLREKEGKKWSQVLEIINREFPKDGKPRFTPDDSDLRKLFRKTMNTRRGQFLIWQRFELS